MMSLTEAKTFSTKTAKIIAGAVARYFTVYGIALLAKWSIIPISWTTDASHIANISFITTIIVYEIEELVWTKYGIDIPGFVTKIASQIIDITKSN